MTCMPLRSRRCRDLVVSSRAAAQRPARTVELTRGHGHHELRARRAEALPARRRRRRSIPRSIVDSRQRHHGGFHRRDAGGHRSGADPDLATGVAIRVDGGRNVTIRNARIRGYKVGILARGIRGLSLARQRSEPQLEAAALQPDRAREPGRLAVVPSQREGRVAALRRRGLSGRRARRRVARQSRRAGHERPAARAQRQPAHLEQHVLVQLRARHRAVSLAATTPSCTTTSTTTCAATATASTGAGRTRRTC